MKISLEEIRSAQKELAAYLPPTPLLKNSWISEAFGCEVYLKLENMQPIGSFKIRGAFHKILTLSKTQGKKGVVAASAGNHAQGVAWGAARVKIPATIVMPKGATLLKVHNTRSLGAEVILHGKTYDEAFVHAQELAKKSGRTFIHAFDDEHVIAGQGTVGLEILQQCPDVDVVIGSIGGGGLMSGVSEVLKTRKRPVKLIGCQASGSPSMIRSFKEGHAVTLESISTFADGIAIKKTSQRMYELLKPRLDSLLEADDEAMAEAILMLMEKASILAEPSGALPLAILSMARANFIGKKVVLIVSGGNIDVNVLNRIIDRGLIRSGRRIRVNVVISDRPGSLAKLTDVLFKSEASIIQAIHDRSEPYTHLDETEVALTLETRGQEHSQEVIQALKKHVSQIYIKHT